MDALAVPSEPFTPNKPMTTTICSIDGTEGLYGLGVRIAIYLQWLVLLITPVCLPGDVPFFRTMNLIFQTAIFSALVMLTSLQQLQPVEPIVVFWLLFGAPSTLDCNLLDTRTRIGLGSLAFYSAMAGYTIWFWFEGLDKMATVSGNSQCTIIAFFGLVSATGRFRTFNKIFSVTLALAIAMAVAISLLLGRGLRERRNKMIATNTVKVDKGKGSERRTQGSHAARSENELPTLHASVTDPNPPNEIGAPIETTTDNIVLRGNPSSTGIKTPNHPTPEHHASSSTRSHKFQTVRFMVSLSFTALSIAAVEYLVSTNNINDIDNVNSVGQFLPLLIAAFGLLEAGYKAVVQFHSGQQTD